MKKIIIYSFTLICLVSIGLCISSTRNTPKNSDLVFKNMEALATIKSVNTYASVECATVEGTLPDGTVVIFNIRHCEGDGNNQCECS